MFAPSSLHRRPPSFPPVTLPPLLSQQVLGEEFYRSLLLPWELDLLADQRTSVLVWAFGALPLALVAFLLIRQWRQTRGDTRGSGKKPTTGAEADAKNPDEVLDPTGNGKERAADRRTQATGQS